MKTFISFVTILLMLNQSINPESFAMRRELARVGSYAFWGDWKIYELSGWVYDRYSDDDYDTQELSAINKFLDIQSSKITIRRSNIKQLRAYLEFWKYFAYDYEELFYGYRVPASVNFNFPVFVVELKPDGFKEYIVFYRDADGTCFVKIKGNYYEIVRY